MKMKKGPKQEVLRPSGTCLSSESFVFLHLFFSSVVVDSSQAVSGRGRTYFSIAHTRSLIYYLLRVIMCSELSPR